jgi:thiol:disulfide interchange protein DsbG
MNRALSAARRTGVLSIVVYAAAAGADELPAPVAALERQGVIIQGSFDAPGGLTGYAATIDGQPLALYLTEDGRHVIAGTLLDEEGNDLTSDQLAAHATGMDGDELWNTLEQTHWIPDGDDSAPRVVYTITDPYCPFCRRFWEVARPWVDAGAVQLRHVMVGVIRDSSTERAAALMESDDPTAELHRHVRADGDVDLPPSSAAGRRLIAENNLTFHRLGFSATPTSFYRDGQRVIPVQGLPQGARVHAVMGGPPP